MAVRSLVVPKTRRKIRVNPKAKFIHLISQKPDGRGYCGAACAPSLMTKDLGAATCARCINIATKKIGEKTP